MKRAFGIFLCGLLPLLLSAQSFTPLLQLDQPLGEQAQVYAFTEDAGVTLFFKEGQEARMYRLDDRMQVLQTFEVQGLPPEDEQILLGFTNEPQSLSLIYMARRDGSYHVLSVAKRDGSSLIEPLDMSRLGNHAYWGTFTYSGILHILRMPRESGTLRLCRFEGGSNFSTLEFALERPDFLEKTGYELTPITESDQPELTDVYAPGKMYHYGDRLYLTLDEPGQTYLITIDLVQGTKTEQRIDAANMPSTASYLLPGQLVQVAAGPDSLVCVVRDLGTLRPLVRYAYGSGDPIDIRAGELIRQDGRGGFQPLAGTADLLADVGQSPYLAVSANVVEDSLVELYAGAVSVTQVRGVTGVVLDEQKRSSHFRAMLSGRDWRAVHRSQTDMAVRRVQVYANKPHPTRFTWQGRSYLGYYDPVVGQYIIGN
ncbi:MAG: hypothetical protein OHK0039_26830 [Bacteroidia bacterium]